MGNCLLTQLKESVDNTNLLKMDEFIISIEFTNENKNPFAFLSATGSGDVTVRTKDGSAIFYVGGSEEPVSSYTVVDGQAAPNVTIKGTGEKDIIVNNKYNIYTINVSQINFVLKNKIFAYLNLPITYLQMSPSTKMYDSYVDDIANIVSPRLRQLAISKNMGITGNFADIAVATMLTQITIGDTGITGTVEEYVERRRAAGDTVSSSPITIPWIGTTGITIGGNSIPAVSGTTLSWTADTITISGTGGADIVVSA